MNMIEVDDQEAKYDPHWWCGCGHTIAQDDNQAKMTRIAVRLARWERANDLK